MTGPGHLLGVALTLALLPLASALLLAQVRTAVDLARGTGPVCDGVQVWGQVLVVWVPALAIGVALLAALLSMSRRAIGWLCLLLALAVSVLTRGAVERWLPGCLP